MIMKRIPIGIAMLALAATLASAEPTIRLDVVDGVARVQLLGDFPQSHYTAYRGETPAGPWLAITDDRVLCLGPCIAEDPEARPGATYWYRFEFDNVDGTRTSFGPLPVSIPATLGREIGLRVLPNPTRGPAEIEIHLAGPTSQASRIRVRVMDVAGRLVRDLGETELPNGLQRLRWDGLDPAGRPLGAGFYFVQASGAGHTVVARVVRAR
jgi:hypothetical protein